MFGDGDGASGTGVVAVLPILELTARIVTVTRSLWVYAFARVSVLVTLALGSWIVAYAGAAGLAAAGLGVVSAGLVFDAGAVVVGLLSVLWITLTLPLAVRVYLTRFEANTTSGRTITLESYYESGSNASLVSVLWK